MPPSATSLHGIVVIDKPLGLTSFDVVSRARRILGLKKIGHAGTLDPLATGVLPLALGEGTKCLHLLTDASKTYRFRIRFGEARSTEDAEGEVTHTSDKRPSSSDILTILTDFTGKITQVPPKYSAIKLGGKRAYDLARSGQEVRMPPRQVTVHSLVLVRQLNVDEAEFLTTVSKGTYIRSLARDMALKLGTCGYVSFLRREAVGTFEASGAISLDFLEEQVHKGAGFGARPWLFPLISLLDGIPACEIAESDLTRIRCGQALQIADAPCGAVAITCKGSLVAFGQSDGIWLKPSRVLNVEP